MNLLEKILRFGEKGAIKKLEIVAQRVNSLEDEFKKLSDKQIKEKTNEFRKRIEKGESLEEILPEAFANVREAAKRTLEQRHFDVQIMGGVALHQGNIAEMKTGEGKTLVSTLPAYLNCLSGKSVHIVTVNDYLAEYQSELMGRIYHFLGVSCGCILTNKKPSERKKEYEKDVVYGTNNEFGFDYLRDNMAWDINDKVQKDHSFAIVDEVDSILIDEARTPLIISGPAGGDLIKWYVKFASVARQLQKDTHYEVEEKKHTVGINEKGIEAVEKILGIENLYTSENTAFIGFLNNAIKAKELFHRDKDYIVRNNEVLIVDEHTGRVLDGRRYNEGMHQAIEAKENVRIKEENQTLATITLQNYFRLYEKLSGMTGTAMTEANEFQSTYEIGVLPIPTNLPMIRTDHPDFVYKTHSGKFKAVIEDIKERHDKGQPILVGTASVERNEELSKMLKREGVPHNVLNAKHHKSEAGVIAMAGRKGAVTVSTNMAGRGTDIMLGGNAEWLATDSLKDFDYENDAEGYEKKWKQNLEKFKKQVSKEHDEVVDLGGLYVLGTERHESRRIDNQLRGRSGRQGDPGESRFYLSMEDELMRLFQQGLAAKVLQSSAFPEDTPLESKMISNSIANAQRQVESQNFEIRKNVLKYDDVMNDQRTTVYKERALLLEKADIKDQIQGYIEDVISLTLNGIIGGIKPDDWDLKLIDSSMKEIFPTTISLDKLIKDSGGTVVALTFDKLLKTYVDDAEKIYKEKEELATSGVMRDLERNVLLSVLDRKWMEHLYEMDYLKEGVGLRAMAQKDPLVEYKTEGYEKFEQMSNSIKYNTLQIIFNAEITIEENDQKKNIKKKRKKALNKAKSNDEEFLYPDTPLNSECPCGSGKKYKQCHGKNDPRVKKNKKK